MCGGGIKIKIFLTERITVTKTKFARKIVSGRPTKIQKTLTIFICVLIISALAVAIT